MLNLCPDFFSPWDSLFLRRRLVDYKNGDTLVVKIAGPLGINEQMSVGDYCEFSAGKQGA